VKPSATGPTLLVAEDDAGLLALAVKILSREGFTVIAARDGQEARRSSSATAPPSPSSFWMR